MLIPQELVDTFQVYASESSRYDSGYDHGCEKAAIYSDLDDIKA